MPEIFQKSSEDNSLSGLNSAVLNTIVEILKDKVQQIIMLSFEASEAYIQQMQQHTSLTAKSDQGLFERMLTQVLDRLTDHK